ncbi:hypothetical protein YSY43_28670 [Paenibacillus sp. YSY-4.3]
MASPKQYPLTHNQQHLHHIEALFPGTKTNNITVSGFMSGVVDFRVLEMVIHRLIQQNEALRIKFSSTGASIQQYVDEYEDTQLELLDFSSADDPQGEFDRFLNSFLDQSVSLTDGFLFKFMMVKIHDEKQGVVFRVHHLIADGYSVSILMNKIWTSYEFAMEQGDEGHLHTLMEASSFFECLDKEASYFESKRYLKDKQYWLDRYQDIPEYMDWGSGNFLSSASLESERWSHVFSVDLSDRIKDFAKKNQLSINTFFVAISYAAVMKLYRKHDLAFGIPVFNRWGRKEKDSLGMFVSTVPYRIRKSPSLSFTELMKSIGHDLMKVFTHQKYPYDVLLNDLSGSLSGVEGLYQISVNYYNVPLKKIITSLPMNYESYHSGEQLHPLNIIIKELAFEPTITVNFDYKKSVLNKEDVQLLSLVIRQMVDQVLRNPDVSIYELEMVASDHREHILALGNAYTADISHSESCIQDKFTFQAKKTPDQIAIIYGDGDTAVTYRQLDEKINRLAKWLRRNGVGQNSIVALYMNRSIEAVIAVLGVLKSGGAFLPVDPSLPPERIQYMLDDSRPELIVCDSHMSGSIQFDGLAVNIHDVLQQLLSTDAPAYQVKPRHLAYMIYTSGTTGTPKGVMIQHKGLSCLGDFVGEYFGAGTSDHVLQFASISFDAFIWELLISLLSGATLHIPTPDIMNNYSAFEQYLNAHKITIATLPPAFLGYLNPEHVHHLRALITAGEALNANLAERWRRRVRLYNGYGPTEATICATLWADDNRTESLKSVPIGKPLDHVEVYIVDEFGCLVPEGIIGELCIGGIALTSGYLNRPELIKEKFIPHPLRRDEVVYKTGDMAKWLQSGDIEFMGRLDHQIKLRGYRIELGEIEAALLSHQLIREAAVVVDRRNDRFDALFAYYVSEQVMEINELRAFLQDKLPNYMIPSYFIMLPDRLPVNHNGKIDRKALIPPASYFNAYLQAPANDTEVQIAAIWAKVLGIPKDQLSVNDHFFDLGGNSLLVMDICTQLEQQFNISFHVSDIFVHGTIRQQADSINRKINEESSTIIKYTQLDDRYFTWAGTAGSYPLQTWEADFEGKLLASMLTAWILAFANPDRTEITVHVVNDKEPPMVLTVHISAEATLKDLLNLVEQSWEQRLPRVDPNDIKNVKPIVNRNKSVIPAIILNAKDIEAYRLIYDFILSVSFTHDGIHSQLIHSDLVNTLKVEELQRKYSKILTHLSTISIQ